MSSGRGRTVVDFSGNTKQAALYFEYVVPVSWYQLLWDEDEIGIKGTQWMLDSVARAIFPPDLDGYALNASLVISRSVDPTFPWKDFLSIVESKFLTPQGIQSEYRLLPSPQSIRRRVEELNASKTKSHAVGGSIYKLKLNPDIVPDLSSFIVEKTTKTDQSTFLSLPLLNLINTRNASWDHIFELRKDERSRAKLRRLRLFTESFYSGKDENFIEDDIANRIEDYQNTVREWGFETVLSSLSQVLSSRSLLGAAAAATSSFALGHPSLAAFAATGGATIELGKISLHIVKRAFELSKMRRDHPLGYIIEARNAIESRTAPSVSSPFE